LQIAFEALSGNGYTGDIALDDITLSDQPCPQLISKILRNIVLSLELSSFYCEHYVQ